MDEKYLTYLKQNRKKIGLSIVIFIFLVALGIFIFSTMESNIPPKSSNNTVYVAGDGSGNFTCDGIDDQVEINQALEYVAKNSQFSTVHLKGPNTYVISDSILIGNNTILEGDDTAVVKLQDNANWPVGNPMITQMGSDGVYGVTIKGFEIDGNHDKNEDRQRGQGYYNMIKFLDAKNVDVNDMYMHDGHGDGLRVERGANITYYNNRVYKLGHDGLFAIDCLNVEAWNNRITCRTNSGLRVWNSNHVKFHDNVIDSFYHWSAGGLEFRLRKQQVSSTMLRYIIILSIIPMVPESG